MTKVQKELAIHDYIVKNATYNTYNYENDILLPEDHNAYGVLIDGIGVCESYAKAMYELCKAAGVECIYVTGTGNGGDHAWNMVKLDDGQWYNVDVTWDDPTYENSSDKIFEVQYDYFNVPDTIFSRTHIRDNTIQYPTANGKKYVFRNLNVAERDII